MARDEAARERRHSVKDIKFDNVDEETHTVARDQTTVFKNDKLYIIDKYKRKSSK